MAFAFINKFVLRNALLNALFLICVFSTYLIFTSFLYTQNVFHQISDPAVTEIELFKGSQNLGELPAVFNSDLVMPFLLVQDVVHDPGTISKWILSPAGYFFPDWLFAALLVILSIPNKLLPLFYSGLQLTILTVSIGLLLNKFSHHNWKLTTTFALAVFLCCGLGVIFSPGSALSYSLFMWLGSPYIHSGAILISLIGIILILQLIENPTNSLRSCYLLACLIFLATLSDFIFVIWFVIPISLFLLWPNSTQSITRSHVKLLGWIAFPSLGAVAIESFVRKSIDPQSKVHLSGSIEQWLSDIQYLWVSADYPMILIVLINGLLLLYLIKHIWVISIKNNSASLIWSVEILFGLICLLALLTPLILNAYRGLALWRYFLILAIIPPIWIGLRISFTLNRDQFKRYIFFPSLTVIVLTISYTLVPAIKVMYLLNSPSTLENCFKSNNLTSGYGDYWNTKSHIFTTNREVHIIQLLNNKPYYYAINRDWFHKRADTHKAIEPNFVILENLSETDIRKLFGEPDQTLTCANKVIWKYDHTLPLPTPNQ
jgi:hypothetical protein